MRASFISMLLSIFLLTACGDKTVKVVEATYPDGNSKLVTYYSDNEAHEKVKEESFYPNGNKERYGEYKNNQRDGIWRVWYQNKILWSEGEYKNGKADGFRKVYYPNGLLRYKGFFKDDKKVGKWEFYDESGKKINEQTF